SSITTLRKIFLELLVMLSPIVPATSEYIYQKLYRSEVGKESIFMIPIQDPDGYDERIISRMDRAREIISKILEWRQRSGIPLRMPVTKIKIEGDLEEMAQVIAIMTNAKEVVFQRVSRADVELDGFRIEIERGNTEEEWLFNEISRRIQFFRKQSGLKRDEIVVLNYRGSERVERIIEKYIQELEERTRSKLVKGDTQNGTRYEIRDLELILKKVS
ncbi:MAG: class I tRNA ligase family protein, partial [Candidatus Micrarchaeota archaeon]|nr:class I tRNA ligase family protein [Candidatus Micrarchaeota archaeon]